MDDPVVVDEFGIVLRNAAACRVFAGCGQTGDAPVDPRDGAAAGETAG